MIQRISKNEDLIDTITGDVSKIKSVKYYTHTDPSIYIHPNEDYVSDEELICRICSEDLATLPSGQLWCEVELETEDSEFCDSKYNEVKKEGFDVWVQ